MSPACIVFASMSNQLPQDVVNSLSIQFNTASQDASLTVGLFCRVGSEGGERIAKGGPAALSKGLKMNMRQD
jgi:hypothetical protein